MKCEEGETDEKRGEDEELLFMLKKRHNNPARIRPSSRSRFAAAVTESRIKNQWIGCTQSSQREGDARMPSLALASRAELSRADRTVQHMKQQQQQHMKQQTPKTTETTETTEITEITYRDYLQRLPLETTLHVPAQTPQSITTSS